MYSTHSTVKNFIIKNNIDKDDVFCQVPILGLLSSLPVTCGTGPFPTLGNDIAATQIFSSIFSQLIAPLLSYSSAYKEYSALFLGKLDS